MEKPAIIPSTPGEAVLGPIEDFPTPSLRLVHVAGRRLLVAATSDGFHVTDNACPHEGYGLVQGSAADGVLTCAWHNWKYRLADGTCLVGEEDLQMHPTSVRDGQLVVHIVTPDPAATRARLTSSLRRGLEDGYVGQISRDVVRLLRADADPIQIVWEAVAWGAPRAEFGFGHAMASLVDCLDMADAAEGDARALPVVAAYAGIAEAERRRPLRVAPEPARDLPGQPARAFRGLLEAEDIVGAEALLRAGLRSGLGPDAVRPWLVGAVSDHHLSYGHAAIYVQKAFALLERLGWDRAETVLPHLVPAIGYATREDGLPYMRAFSRALHDLDLGPLADAGGRDERPVPGDGPDATVRRALLGGRAVDVVPAAEVMLRAGHGVEGLLDVVVGVASHRLLNYDPTGEVRSDRVDFGWLDVTHALTYASAARWAWRAEPGPDTVRLALWSAFLAWYAGRRGYVEIGEGRPDPVGREAYARAGLDIGHLDAGALRHAALEDRSGASIVTAHLIKTSSAAVVEAAATASSDPLRAAARFLVAPRRESFTALQVRKAVQLADGRVPD